MAFKREPPGRVKKVLRCNTHCLQRICHGDYTNALFLKRISWRASPKLPSQSITIPWKSSWLTRKSINLIYLEKVRVSEFKVTHFVNFVTRRPRFSRPSWPMVGLLWFWRVEKIRSFQWGAFQQCGAECWGISGGLGVWKRLRFFVGKGNQI